MKRAVVLFDGTCHLCNGSVQFIIKRDPEGKIAFASLQSEVGKRLMEKYRIGASVDSLILIEKNDAYTESTAALKVARHLKGLWKALIIFRLIPAPIRNRVYRYIAKNRYKWFGQKDACIMPSDELKSHFLDDV